MKSLGEDKEEKNTLKSYLEVLSKFVWLWAHISNKHQYLGTQHNNGSAQSAFTIKQVEFLVIVTSKQPTNMESSLTAYIHSF